MKDKLKKLIKKRLEKIVACAEYATVDYPVVIYDEVLLEELVDEIISLLNETDV